jgi:hypothetical protein
VHVADPGDDQDLLDHPKLYRRELEGVARQAVRTLRDNLRKSVGVAVHAEATINAPAVRAGHALNYRRPTTASQNRPEFRAVLRFLSILLADFLDLWHNAFQE